MNSFSNFNVAELKKSFKTSSLEATFYKLSRRSQPAVNLTRAGSRRRLQLRDGCISRLEKKYLIFISPEQFCSGVKAHS